MATCYLTRSLASFPVTVKSPLVSVLPSCLATVFSWLYHLNNVREFIRISTDLCSKWRKSLKVACSVYLIFLNKIFTTDNNLFYFSYLICELRMMKYFVYWIYASSLNMLQPKARFSINETHYGKFYNSVRNLNIFHQEVNCLHDKSTVLVIWSCARNHCAV